MAEAWLRRLGGRWFEAHSAGVKAGPQINPMAARVMREAGANLSDQWAKDVHIYLGESFDHVITVCDGANEVCPTFPGPHKRAHWSLPDPAAVTGSDQERHAAFIASRDEIKRRVIQFVSENTED